MLDFLYPMWGTQMRLLVPAFRLAHLGSKPTDGRFLCNSVFQISKPLNGVGSSEAVGLGQSWGSVDPLCSIHAEELGSLKA